jgi:hypothetical protein
MLRRKKGVPPKQKGIVASGCVGNQWRQESAKKKLKDFCNWNKSIKE